MSGPLFTFRMIPAIAAMTSSRGLDVRRLLAECGLPDQGLRGEIIAPLERVQRFLDRLAECTADPLFGITLAENIPSGALGVTEFLMRSAPSVGAGIEVLSTFARLINPILEFRVTTQAGDARLHFNVGSRGEGLGEQLNEYTFGLIFRQFALVLGEPLPVEEVWFAHLRAEHRDRVAARFGCPVSFGAPDCGLLVRETTLAMRPPTADPVLYRFLLDQAQALLADHGASDIISQVARVIEAHLAKGTISAQFIAKAIGMTVRSLQRHLADAGTSFREVLQHVRRRRHAELLRSNLPRSEIATRLGFSDVTAMRRSLGGA